MTSIALPTTTTAARALRGRIDGAVVSPSDGRYDEARGTFNLTDDLRPALVAFPQDEREVVAVVDVAREHGLRVAAQGSGHNAGPLGTASDAIVLRTDALQAAGFDPNRPPQTYDEMTQYAAKLHNLDVGGTPVVGFLPRTRRALNHTWWANFFAAWGEGGGSTSLPEASQNPSTSSHQPITGWYRLPKARTRLPQPRVGERAFPVA